MTRRRVVLIKNKLMTTPLPYTGSLSAPVYIIVDPVVTPNLGFKMPLSKGQMQWFVERLRKHGGFKQQDVCIISCAPPISPDDWQSGRATTAHLKEHRDELTKLINKNKPKMILPFGAKACQQVIGRSVQITKMRGQPIQDENIANGTPMLPMLSPFYAQRQPENEAAFIGDLKTAGRIYAADYDVEASAIEYKHDYKWCYDLDWLIKLKPKRLSVDIEGVGLRAYDPKTVMLTVQLTWEPGKAVIIPINYDRGKHRHHNFIPWDTIDRPKLLKQLRTLLEDESIEKLGQNLKFDWSYLWYKLGIDMKNYADDTQLLAHLLDENQLKLNIDDLVRQHVPEMSGYNDALNNDPDHHGKTRMDLLPPEKMLPYGCGDTDAAWRLCDALHEQLMEDTGLVACYNRVTMPAQRAFCHIELNGFPVSTDELRSFEHKLRMIQKRERMYLLRQIPQTIKDKWRGSGVGLKVTRADILRDWLYLHPDGLGLEPKVITKTGVPSISSKMALPYYVADYPIVARLIDFIKNDKLLNTYVKGFYKYIFDDMIRPTYSLVGTVTGRSSCVHADTLIPTQRGNVRIEDIAIGDTVTTHKGNIKPVVRKFLKPVQDMYDVTTSAGNTIRCTEEHRFYTPKGWRSLRNVCIQTALGRQELPQESGKSLHEILAHFDAGCGNGRSHDCDHNSHIERGLGRSEVFAIQDSEILCLENGQQKPHAREEAGKSPAGGVSKGWEWIPDNRSGRKALLRSPGSICGGGGDAPVATSNMDGSASHRRGHREQPTGQLSRVYEDRAFGNTRQTKRNIQEVAITQVHHCGSYPVFDIEVADDHSYLACGVFNHNSRDPNGQNFPKRGKLAKEYRKIFKAPPGWVFLSCDLSQAELRIAAMMSGDRNMLKVYADGGDIHRTTAAGTMGITLEEFLKLPKDTQDLKRYQAKAVNFGFLYGMWWVKFRQYAKTDYGIDFTEEEAKEIRENFFRTYPMLEYWHKDVQEIVLKQAFIRTFDGRIRHLPGVRSPDEGISKQAMRQGINSPVQSIASDLGLMTLGRLMPYLLKKGYSEWFKPCGFIHDAIVCLVKEEHVAQAAGILKTFMENNPVQKWFGWEPEIPIIADAEIGRTLASTYEIKPDQFQGSNSNRSFCDLIGDELKSLRGKLKDETDKDKRAKLTKSIEAIVADMALSLPSPNSRRRVKLPQHRSHTNAARNTPQRTESHGQQIRKRPQRRA